MALVLDAKQFAAYHARLAAQFRPTILRGVRAGAARAIPYLVHRTREAPPANPSGKGTGGAVNTGNFVRRWRAVPLPDGAALVNDTSYGPIIDGGRRPNSRFPPKAALIAWIKRRLLTKAPPRKKSKQPLTQREREERDRKRLEARIRKFAAGDSPRGGGGAGGGGRGGKGRGKPAGGGGRRKSSSIDDQAARLYFPIARAIARRGLAARKILAAPTPRQEILDMVTREVAVEISREMAKR